VANDTLPTTINGLTAAYRTRQLSPVEVTRALLERAEQTQPSLNAFITITAERALEQARRAEHEILRGGTALLLGIPITLKDLFDQRGVATTAGSALRRDAIADADAPVVGRLFAAGAVSLGKTNLHEFAYGVTNNNPHFGPVRNPWNSAHIPGGSSGGAGAAVAAGLGPVGMGSDTGGSIRIPASLCGVVGLKPTYGRVPKIGVFPLSNSLDHAGPLTRTVADAAIVLAVIAGYHVTDPTTVRHPLGSYLQVLGQPLAGLRVGVIEQHLQESDSEVAVLAQAAIETLSQQRAVIRRVIWPDLELIPAAQRPIQYAEASNVHRATLQATPEAYGADIRQRLEEGLSVRAVDYLAAQALRARLRAAAEQHFQDVDVLVGPTLPISAPPIGDPGVRVSDALAQSRSRLTRFTWPYNTTGFPALSVPCGFTNAGLPVGLQIGGRPFDEATILRVGHAYEQATAWHLQTPPE